MDPVPIHSDDKKAVYSIDLRDTNTPTPPRTWKDIPNIYSVFVVLNSHDAFTGLIRQVRQAIEMGRFPERTASGSSGSYLCHSTAAAAITTQAQTPNPVVGIFKPRDEEPYADLNPRWTKWFHRHCSPCCFGRACLMPNGGYLGEAAASLVDRWMGLEMVPRTEIVQLAAPTFSYGRSGQVVPKMGSFQLFVRGFTSYSQVAPLIAMLCAQCEPFQHAFQAELERLICLDHVIRNTDRTEDNWMVRVVWVRHSDGTVCDTMVPPCDNTDPDRDTAMSDYHPIVKIAAIDHGLAFPWRHPDGCRKYPYSWQQLPLTLCPFSHQIRKHVLSVLQDPQKWEHLCLQYAAMVTGCDPSAIHYLPRQLSVLRGQLWTLRQCLLTKDSTPADLVSMARLRVEEDGEHFWKRYGWRKDKAGFKEHQAMGRRWWVREEPTSFSCFSCM